MATQIADLFIKLGVQTEDLKGATNEIKKSLGEVNQSATGMKSGLSGFGDSFKSAMANAEGSSKNLAVGLAGAGAAILGLGGYAMSLAGDLEMTKASFETMLGSAEKSDAMIRDITEFAAKTPFTMNGLQDSAKMLLNFGIESEKIIPTMNMLGDISGGNEEKFKSLSLTFAQVSSAGKLTGGDLMQMINAGFNPLKEISDHTGRSMGELRKEMENGNISFQMVEESMKRVTAEGGMFHGLMEKQAQTLPGLMSTLEDTVVLTMQGIGTALVEATNIKGAIQSVTEGLAAMGEKLIAFFNLIADVGLNEALKQVFSPAVVTAIAAIGGAILMSLVPAMVAWATAAYAAAAASLAALQPFLLAGAAIGAVAYVIYNNWDKIVGFVNSYVLPVFKAVGEVFREFIAPISDTIGVIAGQIERAWSKLVGFFKSNSPDTGKFTDAIERAGEAFDAVFGSIIIYAKMLFDNLKAIFAAGGQVIANIIQAFVNLVTGNWKGLWGNITGIVDSIWNMVKTIFYNGVKAALDIAEKLFSWIPGADTKIAGLKKSLDGMFPDIARRKAWQDMTLDLDTASKSATKASTEVKKVADNTKEVGDNAKIAGKEGVAAMDNMAAAAGRATTSVKGIIAELQPALEKKAREMDFILKLEGNEALKITVAELENTLKRLANETKVDINSDEVRTLQQRLFEARSELDNMTKAAEFQSKINEQFKGLGAVSKATAEDIGKVLEKLYELRGDAGEGTQQRADLEWKIQILELEEASKRMNERLDADIKEQLKLWDDYETALMDVHMGFFEIDRVLTGKDAITAKLELLTKAYADGKIPMEDYQKMYDELISTMESKKTTFGTVNDILIGLAVTAFPRVIDAGSAAKNAFAAVRDVFKDPKSGKEFWDQVGGGFGAIVTAVNTGKSAIEGFGAITGEMIVQLIGQIPGVGTTIAGVMNLLSVFGIDVAGAIDNVINKLKELMALGKHKGEGDYFQAMRDQFDKINRLIEVEKLDIEPISFDEIAGILNLRGETASETIQMIKEKLEEYFEAYLEKVTAADPSGGTTSLIRSMLFSSLMGIIAEYIRTLYPAEGGGGGGGTGTFDPEQLRKFNARLDELSSAYSGAQLWDILASEFGEAITRYVLGNRPLSNAFGSMVAGINEGFNSLNTNFGGFIDSGGVQPSGMQQVIVLTIDGRTLTETVVQGMPEYLRLNLGNGY